MNEETVVWQGHPSQYLNFKIYLICLITSPLVIPIFYAIWRWYELKNQTFTLTNQRLKFSKGVFSRMSDEIELYRIKDIQLFEPFMYRLVGCGNLVVTTSDRTTPVLNLNAIKKPTDLKEQLRKLVEAIRVSRGVREMDLQ